MGRIINEMEADPSQLVRLNVEADIVCENCPNNESGICSTQDKVKRYDEEVLRACGLNEGAEISFAIIFLLYGSYDTCIRAKREKKENN